MKNWVWKLYGIFFTSLVVGGWHDLLTKNSSFRTFYTILIALDKRYIVFLTFNILSILMGVAVSIVIFYYAFNVKSSQKFWKIIFFVRMGIDLAGHLYEFQFIKASFFQSIPYGLACIGVFVIPTIPSYLVHYFYAFKKPSKN